MSDTSLPGCPAVSGAPRILLRLEGLAVLIVCLAAFAQNGGSWKWFAILFLVPDLSFLGYLLGPRIGAILYNAAHCYLSPILLAAIITLTQPQPFPPLWLVWPAHIAFDRALGYGLKYSEAFHFTHLGVLGRRRSL